MTHHQDKNGLNPGIDLPINNSPVKEYKDMGHVYTELRSSLMRFALRFFKNPVEVEDVVQEAFVKVVEAQQTRKIKYINSYMFQTVKNLSLKQIDKSSYRLTDSLGDFSPETVLSTSTMEDQFESNQKLELFCRAVRQLPLKCQRAYILRRVYGFSHQEIAEIMKISIKTVEAHLTKAIVRCTDYMETEGNSADSETATNTPKQYKNG